jgi:uncharacterized protein YoxC
MFLVLIVAVLLLVVTAVVMAAPRKIDRELDATTRAFEQLRDGLRPATIRLDKATRATQRRRPSAES